MPERGARLTIALATLTILLVGSSLALAQSEQPVFRAGVELVRLDVRITGADGRPVTDLTRDDFEVLEGNERQPILLFQHIEEPSAPLTEVARRTVAGEVSTNRGAARGHLYVLVFDQEHITAGNEHRARLAAERFLRTRFRPGDRVALYAVPGPGPQLDFTGQLTLAVEELPKVRGSLERTEIGPLGVMRVFEAYEIRRGNQQILDRVANNLRASGTDAMAAIASPLTAGTSDPSILKVLVQEEASTIVHRADESSRRFLAILSDLVRRLRAIEDRKVVVLFSEGFFLDNLSREIEQVAAAAAQSYSVFYSIDLNSRGVDIRQTEPLGGEAIGEVQSRLEPLATLALETDGQLVPDASTRLDQVLGRIADESQDYYLVGFAPSPVGRERRDGYHRVKVRVRREGVTVRTRTGYSLGTASTAADRRRAIDLVFAAPFPLQQLALEYTTYVLRGSAPGLQKVFVSLEAELPVADGDGRAGSADVVFVVRSVRDGRVMASGTDTIALPATSREDATTGTASYRVQFELPPGAYLMRTLVREPGGLVGSADRRFDVPALYGANISGSDLILGVATSGRLPVRATTHADTGLTGVLQIYGSNPDALEEVEVRIDLLPVGDDTAVLSTLADIVGPIEGEHGASSTAQIDLPLTGLAPGPYVTRAVVRAGGTIVSERLRELVVLPGAAPLPERAAAPAAGLEPTLVLEGALARRYVKAVREGADTPAVGRAAALADAGRWPEVEQALGSDAGTAGYLGLRGLARFADGRYDEAARDLHGAFTRDPQNADAAFLLGWAHAASGDDRGAISSWRSAAYLDPTLIPAHLALADAYERLSQRALALQAIRAGLRAVPGSRELRDRLAALEGRTSSG